MQNLDAPRWLLDLFRLDRAAGIVRWATLDELKEEPPMKRRRGPLPYGQPAGGRIVAGHGKLVSCSGRALLTSDIKRAILEGYEWPWDSTPRYTVAGEPGPDDAASLDSIRRNWTILDGVLVWNLDAHSTLPLHTEARGTHLPGRDAYLVSRYDRAYLREDILFVLEHGRFPWQEAWD